MSTPETVVLVTLDPTTAARLESLMEAVRRIGALGPDADLDDLLNRTAALLGTCWERSDAWSYQMIRTLLGF